MDNIEKIISEIDNSISLNDYSKNLEKYISKNSNIYLAGKGRSGIVIQGFANRLMHLGYNVHIVGDVTAPHTKNKDTLILCSRSGETKTLIPIAEQAKQSNLKVLLFTESKQSTLSKLADTIFLIKSISDTIQPMGTLFEQLSFLVFDSIILDLMEKTKKTEQEMKHRHANLE